MTEQRIEVVHVSSMTMSSISDALLTQRFRFSLDKCQYRQSFSISNAQGQTLFRCRRRCCSLSSLLLFFSRAYEPKRTRAHVLAVSVPRVDPPHDHPSRYRHAPSINALASVETPTATVAPVSHKGWSQLNAAPHPTWLSSSVDVIVVTLVASVARRSSSDRPTRSHARQVRVALPVPNAIQANVSPVPKDKRKATASASSLARPQSQRLIHLPPAVYPHGLATCAIVTVVSLAHIVPRSMWVVQWLLNALSTHVPKPVNISIPTRVQHRPRSVPSVAPAEALAHPLDADANAARDNTAATIRPRATLDVQHARRPVGDRPSVRHRHG
jgi:hypothetical protein